MPKRSAGGGRRVPRTSSVARRWAARNSGLVHDSFGWDVVNWSAAADFWRTSTAKSDRLGDLSALEVGAGAGGGLSLWLASQGMNVLWSSYTHSESDATEVHRQYGVEANISYRRLDILNIDPEERYDIVAMKSVLGLIASGGNLRQAQAALANIRKLLRPGGELWLVENLRATRVHQFLRDRRSWGKMGSGWYYPSLSELQHLLEPFDNSAIMTTGVIGLGGRTEAQRSILGGIDALFLERVVPPRWRYIGAAVATVTG